MTVIQDLKTELTRLGFCPFMPEAPAIYDQPIVEIVDRPDGMRFRLQCSNCCVRDQNHECGVPLTASDMAAGVAGSHWKAKVCARIPWMLVEWGPHRHVVAFCTSTCLIEFVKKRTEQSIARHEAGLTEHDHGHE